jgi:hypothetical protein
MYGPSQSLTYTTGVNVSSIHLSSATQTFIYETQVFGQK